MHCIADICVIPIGTGSPSVSPEIATALKTIRASGLKYTLHGYGTGIEGEFDDVMNCIKQIHLQLHESGVVRVSSDIRLGTRTDKAASLQAKMDSVNALLMGKTEESKLIDEATLLAQAQ